jgi:uncharacterized membrane protein
MSLRQRSKDVALGIGVALLCIPLMYVVYLMLEVIYGGARPNHG